MTIWIGRDNDGSLGAYRRKPIWCNETGEWSDLSQPDNWLQLDGRGLRSILRSTCIKARTTLVPPARS